MCCAQVHWVKYNSRGDKMLGFDFVQSSDCLVSGHTDATGHNSHLDVLMRLEALIPTVKHNPKR